MDPYTPLSRWFTAFAISWTLPQTYISDSKVSIVMG